MEAKRISITTKNGTNYLIDFDGCFLKYNQHEWQHPHNSWKCTGVAKRGAFNHMKGFNLATFIDMAHNGQITTFKNGSPQFYLRDLDHGTHRLQMDGIVRANIT